MKILWGSPLPPIRSGVSDYAVELLGALGQLASVRVLSPPGGLAAGTWTLGNGVKVVPTHAAALDDEISLIHLGNNPHHAWLLDRLRAPRTVVVLHDLVLHHLLVETTDPGTLETRLEADHGEAGAAVARGRRYGLSSARDPFLFPARSGFLAAAAGVIVHSRWAEGVIAAEAPDLPRAAIGLAVADPGPVVQAAERGRLGIVSNDVVLMHLGFLTPEKGLEEILTGLAAARRAGVPVRLVLVGEGSGIEAVKAAARLVGVSDRVSTTGWIESESFPKVPAAADLGIVLRTPSAGETSAAAVRFLACGTPVAVGGRRQFLELPEQAAPRITPGPSAPAEIARLLGTAAKRGRRWQARRKAARAAYEANHRPDTAAAAICNFLGSLGL